MLSLDKGRGVFPVRIIATLATLLALSGCGLPVFFRVPIVQGNIVTADQVDKLQMGMTKKQVAYVLGTPLIKAPFESDRWDYVFYYRNPRAHVRQSKLDIYFVNDRLDHIEGDEEYQAAVNAVAQGKNNDTPLPGSVSSTGAPLGVGAIPGSPVPGNASQDIPHTDTSRPDPNQNPVDTSGPQTSQPTGVGNDGALPPLPGRPGI